MSRLARFLVLAFAGLLASHLVRAQALQTGTLTGQALLADGSTDIVTSAPAPLVVGVIAPVTASVSSVMSALAADVVNAPVPAAETVPASVMLPVVAVTSRLPPTVEAARFTPIALTIVALPEIGR